SGPRRCDGPVERLRVWSRTPGAIVNQRLAMRLPRPGAPDFRLVASLSVSLAEVSDELPGPGSRLWLRSTREGALGETGTAVQILVVRHLLATEHGVLALAFSAAQPQFYDVLEPLFSHVAQTVRLDPWQPGED